jgi:hypothetical protein
MGAGGPERVDKMVYSLAVLLSLETHEAHETQRLQGYDAGHGLATVWRFCGPDLFFQGPQGSLVPMDMVCRCEVKPSEEVEAGKRAVHESINGSRSHALSSRSSLACPPILSSRLNSTPCALLEMLKSARPGGAGSLTFTDENASARDDG